MSPGIFSQSPDPEQIQEKVQVLYRAMSAWNSLPSYIAQVNSLVLKNKATSHGM
jgi:hypothetical protein